MSDSWLMENKDFITLVCTITGTVIALVGALVKLKIKRKAYQSLGFDKAEIKKYRRYYLKPNFQDTDPSEGDDPKRIITAKQSLFDMMKQVLFKEPEYRHIMVLAGSGMGKTAFLINYFLKCRLKWFGKAKIQLYFLNDDGVDGKVKEIPNKAETILFLDALDEDAKANEDCEQRIKEILELTKDFKKTVITCRAQFFLSDDEIPLYTGNKIKGPRELGKSLLEQFHRVYLSPFSNTQVKRYIKKRYSILQRSKRKRALEIVIKSPNVFVRPMILAYIDDLMGRDEKFDYSFQIYEVIVEEWIKRDSGGFEISEASLRTFSEKLAIEIFVNRKKRGGERIPVSEIKALTEEWGVGLDKKQFTSRSLLNRDAVGNYKFAHRSIMEYLFAKSYYDGKVTVPHDVFTDQSQLFLDEIYDSKGVIRVPGGPFLYGSREDDSKAFDSEKPQQSLDVPEFYIDKYPVTNKQFQAFIEAGGYDKKEYWIDESDGGIGDKGWRLREDKEWTKPLYWDNEKWNRADCPVVGVSWYEASAYARWAGKRLPSEVEWEKAARGVDGRTYPWGDKWDKSNCNNRKSGPGKTTEAGKYGKGKSPYGCHDMSGNVWEWCSNLYSSEGTYRVLRGGSWSIGNSRSFRCACRGRNDPEDRNYYCGFRCVLS